ncbi:MAG: gliding motility lipoprotein GldH [Puia sp.]
MSFEKNLTFDNHAWPSSVKPDIAFEITDTVSTYNIYIVLRHTDGYHFNNIYIRATVKEPGDPKGRTGDYDLQLATNDKGWIGTAMDDIYDARLLIQPKTRFRKSGVYHITMEQHDAGRSVEECVKCWTESRESAGIVWKYGRMEVWK